jgi:hypothetical protein
MCFAASRILIYLTTASALRKEHPSMSLYLRRGVGIDIRMLVCVS